jgi:hypothetical protein
MRAKILLFDIVIISMITLLMIGCAKSNSVESNYDNSKPNNIKIGETIKLENSQNNVQLEVTNDIGSEGISKVLNNISNEPKLIVAYYSPKMDGNLVYSSIKSKYPKSIIYGASVNNEIISSKGISTGIGVLSIEDNKFRVGSSGRTLTASSNIKSEVTDILSECNSNAGVDASSKPVAIYVSTVFGLEEYVDAAIEDIYGKDLPIYGGTPSAAGANISSSINSNGSVNGTSILCFYDNVGASYKSGFLSSKDKSKTGTVTKVSDARTITEIDAKNALDVLNSWTNNAFSSETVGAKDQFNLIAKENKTETVTMAVNTAAKTGVSFYANVNVGDELHYVPATVEPLINRATPLVRDALVSGNIHKSNIDFGLVVLCAGARAKMDDQLSIYLDSLNTSLNSRPWIGIVADGEEGFVKGSGSFHGNFMNSIIIKEAK